MQRFLTIYLLVTGALAFLALAMPGLVVLGFFLLIVPGLVLSFAPTAFLWGCAFAASWFAVRTILPDTWTTVLAAGVVTLVALFAVTEPNRAAGKLAQAVAMRPDVAPPTRIAMKGDVRLDLPRPRWDNKNPSVGQRGFSCDNLCIALLFTPGVTSVTINNSSPFSVIQHRDGTGPFDSEARTYRLMPKGQCPGGGLQPDLEGRIGLFPGEPGKLEAGRALASEWALKFASEVCLTRSPPIDHHDILIRQGRYGGPNRRSSWSLMPALPSVDYVEIRDARGTVLLRRFQSSVRVLTRLLAISGEGGIENFRFGWATTELSNKPRYSSIDLLKELEAHTDTRGAASGADLLPAIRRQLRAALADPSLTGEDPAFQLIPGYIDALPNPLPADDLQLMVDLARDDRIARYENIWKLAKLPSDQQRPIAEAFVARANTTDQPQVLLRSLANVFIEKIPDGSFSSLTSEEEHLLDQPQKRWALPSLAGRLYEVGPSTVPRLVTLIREHSLVLRDNHAAVRTGRLKAYETDRENEGHRQMVDAARKSLCRMGPEASAAIAPLDAMLSDGTIDRTSLWGHNGAQWGFTLARLGKPIDQLRKPDSLSGSEVAYRERIRRKLERFRPERDC